MRRVFWLFFVMFALVAFYLTKLVVADARDIASNPYNRRLNVTDGTIRRGYIYDSNNNILVQSNANYGGGFSREYVYGQTFAHLIGYTAQGKTGIEQYYNFEMEKLNWEIIQRISNAVADTELVGNSVVTTLDLGLQQLVYKQLDGKKGAVVVLEPSTGKVLAMASSPGFDPNTINVDWGKLIENENSPLINRGTQGLYPPGSTFKIITAAAAIELDPELVNFEHECTGEAAFDGKVIRCSNSKAHGKVDMKKAMEVSCNTYFATLGEKIGAESLTATAESFYFNKDYGYTLEYNESRFSLPEQPTVSELIETSIGQGRTLATPLNMAMVISAVGNGGQMMTPYVVDSICDKNGNVLRKYYPQSLGQSVKPETAEILNEMLVGVVRDGTGKPASVSGVTVAGKTGTAQNESGKDHSWFVVYAPAEKPTVAVAIILEQTGGGTKATAMAKEILSYALKNEK